MKPDQRVKGGLTHAGEFSNQKNKWYFFIFFAKYNWKICHISLIDLSLSNSLLTLYELNELILVAVLINIDSLIWNWSNS